VLAIGTRDVARQRATVFVVNAPEALEEFTVMAAKKLKKASSKPVSKSAFVRGLSTSLPAKGRTFQAMGRS